jgi:hypothetical protein
VNGLGDAMIGKLAAVETRGGWLKAGYDFGPNNRLHVLLAAGMLRPDGLGDYVVTAAGRALLTSGWKRRHRLHRGGERTA